MKNPLGPAGERVRENIRRIRTEQRMSYRELGDRLEALGRSIPQLGLARIEKGERRVDADDLVALAAALEVDVAALLWPPALPSVPFEHAGCIDGVEGILDRQARWARARELLVSGALTPSQLIAETTDQETLHALADELPTFLRAYGLRVRQCRDPVAGLGKIPGLDAEELR